MELNILLTLIASPTYCRIFSEHVTFDNVELKIMGSEIGTHFRKHVKLSSNVAASKKLDPKRSIRGA